MLTTIGVTFKFDMIVGLSVTVSCEVFVSVAFTSLDELEPPPHQISKDAVIALMANMFLFNIFFPFLNLQTFVYI